MSNERICTCCGCIIDDDMNDHTYHDDIYCEDCFNAEFTICGCCGDVEPIEDMTYLEDEDRYICEYCLNNYYFECEICGEIFHNDFGQYLEDDFICEDCFDRHAVYCDRCDDYVYEENYDFDAECCCECANDLLIGSYHSHSFYKVGASCVDKNIFHKGVELEIENAKRSTNNLDMAQMLSETYSHMVFENDGSLNTGFEIITQPHTFEQFRNIPWEMILNLCSSNGFRSHDTDTCGLHIHYSREFFGMTTDEQEENVGKLIAFYERNLKAMLRLSRRTWDNYRRWAHGYDTDGDVEACKECAKQHNERYHYINMNNYRTIEFRLGRGTLNYASFMAWNDLHDCLVKNVKNVSYEDIDNLGVWFNGINADTVKYFIDKGCFMDFVEMYRREV